jgi:hypothetical protein
MFYLFMLMLLWAALRSVERQLDALPPRTLVSDTLAQ